MKIGRRICFCISTLIILKQMTNSGLIVFGWWVKDDGIPSVRIVNVGWRNDNIDWDDSDDFENAEDGHFFLSPFFLPSPSLPPSVPHTFFCSFCFSV